MLQRKQEKTKKTLKKNNKFSLNLLPLKYI